MDQEAFDRFTRGLGTAGSRRAALRALLASLAATLLPASTAARRGRGDGKRADGGRGKKQRRGNNRGAGQGNSPKRRGDKERTNGKGGGNNSSQNAGKHDRRRKKVPHRQARAQAACYNGSPCIPGPGKNLGKCDFSGSPALKGKNLKGANLGNASVAGGDASGADLRGANLGGTCLVDADLTGAQITAATNIGAAILCRTTMPDGSTNNSGCAKGTKCCPTCDEDNSCGGGEVCCNGRCRPGDCCTNDQCTDPAEPICLSNRCTPCTTNQQCGNGRACCEGRCRSGDQCCGEDDEPCCGGGDDGGPPCSTGLVCDPGGICVRCGVEGNLCCDGRACDAGLRCMFDNFCHACGGDLEFCCADMTCNAGLICEGVDVLDVCIPCGGDGESCCDGAVCDAGAECLSNNECRSCGARNEVCCSGGSVARCNADDLFCSNGFCQDCGRQEELCCAGATCGGGLVCEERDGPDICVSCGGLDERCCAGGVCDADLDCQGSGTCRPCGALLQRCCGDAQTCDAGLACARGQCLTCGGDGEPCCTGGACDGALICNIQETCSVCDVCPSGCPFTSVALAIELAPPGATIRICPGVYATNAFIGQDVTLIGAGDGPGGTILDGQGSGSVLRMRNAGTVVVRDLTITGGRAPQGGGIFIERTVVTLRGVHVSGNRFSELGGGIYNFQGGLTLVRGHVTANLDDSEAPTSGGGIHNSGELSLDDSHVSGNRATTGGGITNDGGSVTLVGGSSVTGNFPDNCVGTPACSP